MDWQQIILYVLGGAGGFSLFQFILGIRDQNTKLVQQIPEEWKRLVDELKDDLTNEREIRRQESGALWDRLHKQAQDSERQRIEYQLNLQHTQQKISHLEAENNLLKKENTEWKKRFEQWEIERDQMQIRIETLEQLVSDHGLDTGELKRKD